MKPLHIITSFILGIGILHGRIYENLEQCQSRYGNIISDNQEFVIFEKDGVLIKIFFFEGKADKIAYEKKEKSIIGMPLEFTDAEMGSLLMANCSHGWTQVGLIPMNSISWKSADDALLANYYHMGGMLEIVTAARIKREKDEEIRKQSAPLKGF